MNDTKTIKVELNDEEHKKFMEIKKRLGIRGNADIMRYIIERESKQGYITLNYQQQFDIIKLRDGLNNIINGDTAIGLSMKWLDVESVIKISEIHPDLNIFIGNTDPSTYYSDGKSTTNT